MTDYYLCHICHDRYTSEVGRPCHACLEQSMIDDAVPTPFDWRVWDKQVEADEQQFREWKAELEYLKAERLGDIDDNRPSAPMVGVVTVSPEAKQQLMDGYGLTESDFIADEYPDPDCYLCGGTGLAGDGFHDCPVCMADIDNSEDDDYEHVADIELDNGEGWQVYMPNRDDEGEEF